MDDLENEVLEDEVKELDAKIAELRKLETRTPEQEAEIKELKAEKQTRFQKRINKQHALQRAAEERAERAERELEDLRKKQQQTVREVPLAGGSVRPSISANGEMFYSNAQLNQLVQAGQMTQADAEEHYEARLTAVAEEKVSRKFTERETVNVREQDRQKVLAERPDFDPTHPSHNPNDPLFKEADRIYRNGYASNPRGLSLALEEAKRIVGTSKRPDMSNQLSVTSSNAPASRTSSQKVELTPTESDWAINYYVYGGLKNPATGKSYTKAEAQAKYLQIKERKLAKGGN